MSDDDIHNERLKLFASWLNALGSGTAITGGIAPLIAAMIGLNPATNIPAILLILSSVIWILIGFALNYVARRSLRSLR